MIKGGKWVFLILEPVRLGWNEGPGLLVSLCVWRDSFATIISFYLLYYIHIKFYYYQYLVEY